MLLRLQRDAASRGGRFPALGWLRGGLERLLVSTAAQVCGVPVQRISGFDDTFHMRFNGGDWLRLSFFSASVISGQLQKAGVPTADGIDASSPGAPPEGKLSSHKWLRGISITWCHDFRALWDVERVENSTTRAGALGGSTRRHHKLFARPGALEVRLCVGRSCARSRAAAQQRHSSKRHAVRGVPPRLSSTAPRAVPRLCGGSGRSADLARCRVACRAKAAAHGAARGTVARYASAVPLLARFARPASRIALAGSSSRVLCSRRVSPIVAFTPFPLLASLRGSATASRAAH